MPGDWALRELPARVVVFLRAVGTHAPIQGAMRAGGYGARDHEEGARLLAATFPFSAQGLDPAEDDPPRAAARELETWLKTHLPRLRAAVERLHPDSLALFHGLDSLDGPETVLGAAQLVERLAALRADSQDAAVLETLERRGLGAARRRWLARLVRTAQTARVPGNAVTVGGEEDVLGERGGGADGAMLELYRWYQDWAATARAMVKRRDWLIRMGLMARKRAGRG